MQSYNYKLNNNSLEETIDFSNFIDKKNVLIQIFCGKDKSTLEKVIEKLKSNLPQAVCIAASSDGEILNDEVLTKDIIISISVFENTTLKATSSTNPSSYQRGIELAFNLIQENTKLLILFTNTNETNSEEFLRGVESVNKDIIVCGGIASCNELLQDDFIALENDIFTNAAVGVALNSDILNVQNDYRLNWSSIGIEHPITKAVDNIVYEIDGLKTADFYKKYLGKEVLDSLPCSVLSFPLLVKRKNEFICRALIKVHEDGGFEFTGNLSVGTKVKFGFGNAEMILKNPIIPHEKEYSNTESFFIYSCLARRRYIPDSIYYENAAYSNITDTCGFFTQGEFFHNKNGQTLLNQSMTVVALSENIYENKAIKSFDKNEVNNSNKYAKTIQTLSHLIEQSSKDYDEQSKNLEVEKFNSQMLLTSQKIFLRHAVHETNTPISVIMSNIELFEMEYGKNPYLSTIEVALKNIFNIYDDLSYLVKKDQVEYPKKYIDIIDFIRSRIDFFEQSAQQIGSQIKFNSHENELLHNFNETKLQRIIDNNLTNAIKYTEENSHIYINLEKKKNAFALTISSCSQYIQYPEKIFKEYYREESTKQGFGLGLSLVKRICDEENIKISIDSNEYFTSFRYLFKMEDK